MKSFKDLSWKLKRELDAKGVQIPASQLMDALSKALDFKSYDQVKALPEEHVISKVKSYTALYPLYGNHSEVESVGENHYEIIIEAAGILKKSIGINATSPQVARDRAMKYLTENEDYCRDSGEGWSFDYINAETACVSEMHQFLDKDEQFSNSVQLFPFWDLSSTLYSSKKELDEDFEKQVAGFETLEKKLHDAAFSVQNPKNLRDIEPIIAGLKSLSKKDLESIRKDLGMSFYDYMSKKYYFKSRDQDYWKESFDFIKSLG